jgi:CBS domain-containing protein
MRVEQLMTRPAVTCAADDTATRAAQLMWDFNIGCVVVLDASQLVTGIITDRDLCMAAYTKGATLSHIHVREVMSKRVAVVRAHDRLALAEALMRRRKVRRLPVVDKEDRLVGLLSLADTRLEGWAASSP